MYDIRQFLPSMFLLLLLGMSGFALAAQSAGIWVLSVGGILLNAWLVKTKRFRPLPRVLANLITLVSLVYVFLLMRRWTTAPILVIGQFLVVLQLVKLYEQRGNRDYAQLLILSLLLMVAASINTASLAFGVLLIIYLFLSLYCCLLFHLKVETDHAKAAIGLPEDKLNPMTLRQDQRYLPRSMRRLTMLVSGCGISMAVVVFLFFPRNTGAGLLGPLQFKPKTLTGFSDKMSFQQVAQITQNSEIVAYVKLFEDERPIEGTQPLLLRGVTLDLYAGNAPNAARWQWTCSSGPKIVTESGESDRWIDVDRRNEEGTIRQEVVLNPSGTDVLFAVAGATEFKPVSMDSSKIRFHTLDQSMRNEPQIAQQARYEVLSTGHLTQSSFSVGRPADAEEGSDTNPQSATSLARSVIDPQIEAYARRPEVSGTDARGLLVSRRKPDVRASPLDIEIARNIERHLKGEEFQYTLDLTDALKIGEDRDPVVAFLYDLKRGHCEYFAGAMTLMCQSLGMQARVVVGFKCDEYNALTHSYIVRQNHAHAWVEVLDENGEWITFDPTSGRESTTARTVTLWKKLTQFVDYLEYTWANSVVAYDRDARSNLIQNVETQLNNTANTGADRLKKASSWFDFNPSDERYWIFSSRVITVLIAVLSAALVVAVGWFGLERWKLRRRVRRIGLAALPADAQLRLARQLGFYDDLLRLLARHDIICPPNLTPLEFSERIAFLPSGAFDAVRRLTRIFYRIRYGRVELSWTQQRRLSAVITKIEGILGAVGAGM